MYIFGYDLICLKGPFTEKVTYVNAKGNKWVLGKHFVTYRYFSYLFEFPGKYSKVNIITYWIEVLHFVGLKESITENFQTI